jgi:hypothetical protein
MSEETAPKPFPDARPPHIPDAITRQSPWLFVFALLAVYQLVAGWRSWSGEFPIPMPDQIPLLAHSLIPSSIVPLMGVALFLRRPDARRSMPLLVFGLVLLSGVTLLEDFDTPIYEALSGGDPSQSDSPGVVAYAVFKSLARLFGLVYIGAGVASARSQAPTRMHRAVSIWLVALAVVAIVITPLGPISILSSPTIAEIIAAAIGLILTFLVILAWGYLVSTTVGGWLAGESPNGAWALGSLAATILFAHRIFAQLIVWFGESAFGISQVASYISLVAWVLLLIAVAMGLPSPAPAASATGEDEGAMGDRQAATPPGSGAG